MSGSHRDPNPEDLEAAIHAAFAGVKLGRGISLRQAEAIDRRQAMTGAVFDGLSPREVTDDWAAVPSDELDRDNIAHLDADGLRYYLPAFMLRLLGPDVDTSDMASIGTIFALDQRERHPPDFLELLSPEQRRTLARYVVGLPSLVELDHEDRTRLSRAFRDVWSRDLATDHDE